MSAGRVTEGMLGRRLLSDLRASTHRIADAQRQIASGKRIDKPSDDPLATHNAMRLRSELAGIEQDLRNACLIEQLTSEETSEPFDVVRIELGEAPPKQPR